MPCSLFPPAIRMVHVAVTLRTGLCCALLPQALQETEVDTTFVLPASVAVGAYGLELRNGLSGATWHDKLRT